MVRGPYDYTFQLGSIRLRLRGLLLYLVRRGFAFFLLG